MNKKWIKIGMAGIAAVTMLFGAGCQTIEQGTNTTLNGYQPISPIAQAASAQEIETMVYYRFQSENFLAAEPRKHIMTTNELPERAIIGLVLAGPSANQTEMKELFNPEVRANMPEVQDQGNKTLLVILHESFLDPPAGVDSEAAEGVKKPEILQRRKLGLYAIVNSVIELGNYEKVNFQVRVKDMVRPINKSDIEASAKEGEALGALSRQGEVILTAERAFGQVMEYLKNKDWDKLYQYISLRDRPSLDEMRSIFSGRNISLDKPQYGDVYVAANGKSATLTIKSFEILSGEKVTVYTGIPVRMVRENDIWKVNYATINTLWNENVR